MAIPKEPRQLMINLMYLVLTALLALNVSNEILNAFKTLYLSIDKSNSSINLRTNELYTQIKESENLPGQKEKVQPFRIKADEVVSESDKFVQYLEDWKKRLVINAGGYSEHEKTMPDKPDNIDATTLLLVEKKGGDTLRKKIEDMRQFLLAKVPGDSAILSKQLPLGITPAQKNEHNPTGDWNIENFEHMPVMAALALFSKFQNDVRSSEAIVIKRLSELAHTREATFDTMMALAVPKTTYALQGDKIEAQILLAAFNKANRPSVAVQQGGGSSKPPENGVISWETTASGTGLQTVKGTLTYDDPALGKKAMPWSFEYMVGTSGASVQLDKMNVCYVGVPNPVTISAAGYALEDVYLEFPTGSGASGKPLQTLGKYELTFTSVNPNLQIKVMAKSKVQGGAPATVATVPVRVKTIPDPIVTVGGKREGLIPTNRFKVEYGPIAKLENFDFDAKFKIIEFEFSIVPKGDYLQGPFVAKNANAAGFNDNADIAKWRSRCKPGDRIFIEKVKGIGPDNKVRTLNPVSLTLN